MDLLSRTTELDYLTHLVFRLYENKSVPADHPLRFKLEILFSSGAAYAPTEVSLVSLQSKLAVAAL
jgi:inositol hexakisphosphate/diphosphoinositol-pentakisphosphate kinase